MPTRKPKKVFDVKKINGIEIRQRISDGYIDAISICDACDKDFADFMQVRFTKRFLTELSRDTKLMESELIQKQDGVDEIWVHPLIALNLSQWASPKIAVKIPQWIMQWYCSNNKSDFVSTSGVRFEDIDPTFTSMIQKATQFNPDKINAEK